MVEPEECATIGPEGLFISWPVLTHTECPCHDAGTNGKHLQQSRAQFEVGPFAQKEVHDSRPGKRNRTTQSPSFSIIMLHKTVVNVALVYGCVHILIASAAVSTALRATATFEVSSSTPVTLQPGAAMSAATSVW
eukprot:CAMPEP_0172881004 /NCGR_PEP_ID=MMETSP1075-20121228/116374_1 /TAXON_ID=2916 /ORGANISM="Ceratium fusus, Strain PA161109" /LENGTH=134 /DNA_ID=CAMNT_0013733347 /DNA_START=263 /DNA_END=665 /DNA_ORIENTATION=+